MTYWLAAIEGESCVYGMSSLVSKSERLLVMGSLSTRSSVTRHLYSLHLVIAWSVYGNLRKRWTLNLPPLVHNARYVLVVAALVMTVLMAIVAAPVIKKWWYVWKLLHLRSYQRWLKKDRLYLTNDCSCTWKRCEINPHLKTAVILLHNRCYIAHM
eukprot:TCONS_00013984-protein